MVEGNIHPTLVKGEIKGNSIKFQNVCCHTRNSSHVINHKRIAAFIARVNAAMAYLITFSVANYIVTINIAY